MTELNVRGFDVRKPASRGAGAVVWPSALKRGDGGERAAGEKYPEVTRLCSEGSPAAAVVISHSMAMKMAAWRPFGRRGRPERKEEERRKRRKRAVHGHIYYIYTHYY